MMSSPQEVVFFEEVGGEQFAIHSPVKLSWAGRDVNIKLKMRFRIIRERNDRIAVPTVTLQDTRANLIVETMKGDYRRGFPSMACRVLCYRAK